MVARANLGEGSAIRGGCQRFWRSVTVGAFVASLLQFSTLPSHAQAPGYRAGTTSVLVDVVVRDRKGLPVTDLSEKDFEIREDGIPQTVDTAILVAPGDQQPQGGETNGRTTHLPNSDLPKGNAVVALVFDRLTPEGRALAGRAAAKYVAGLHQPVDFYGVFLIDLSLKVVQIFTDDKAAVQKAIEQVARTATSPSTRDGLPVRSPSLGSTDSATPPTAGAESSGKVDAPTQLGVAERTFLAMANGMERDFERLTADQQGSASTRGLQAVVQSLGPLAGRKTVIYFSEGLQLPDAVISSFDRLIDSANRENVTFYAVDSAGLRVQSDQAAAGRVLREIGDPTGALAAQNPTNEDPSDRYDRAFSMMRSDAHQSLGKLAALTGGFLMDNTNDLTNALQRIDSDRRFHYLVSYRPTNSNFKGEHRTIVVTVKRKALTVRSRHGYLAAPVR